MRIGKEVEKRNLASLSLLWTDSLGVRELLAALDSGGRGVLVLIDSEGKLKGVVTDGDVRRSLLRTDIGDITVELLVNSEPRKWLNTKPKGQALWYMKHNRIRHLPIVDADNRVTGILSVEDLDSGLRSNPIVLMAGGQGKRLRPLTEKIPKPMLKVGDRPIIQRVIERIASHGFFNFYICVNYLKEQIMGAFGGGHELGVDIKYVEEDKFCGTAGALAYLNGEVKESFLVMNSDLITAVNFGDLIQHHEGRRDVIATMLTKRKSFQLPFGVVDADHSGDISKISEKPEVSFEINAGIYVLNPSVLSALKKGEWLDMPTLFEKIIGEGGRTRRHLVDDYVEWIDIGNMEEYQRVCKNYEQLIHLPERKRTSGCVTVHGAGNKDGGEFFENEAVTASIK